MAKYRVFANQEMIEADNAHEAAREYFKRLRSESSDILIVVEEDPDSSVFSADDIHEFERRQLL